MGRSGFTSDIAIASSSTTATGSYKAARMETGSTVMVPQFVNKGEKIRVNTGDGSDIDRA